MKNSFLASRATTPRKTQILEVRIPAQAPLSFLVPPKTGKQKNNAKHRKLYQKWKKAKEAKAKAAAAAASDNSSGSKQ